MKNPHKIFSLPTPLLWLLVAANFIYALFLDWRLGSYFSWNAVDMASQHSLQLANILAVGQFVILGLTADMLIRHFVVRFNKTATSKQLPAVFVQAITGAAYGLAGIFAFIALYDHSASQILAASGAIGLSVLYIFRDAIADVMACVQLQTDGLLSIGDFIKLSNGTHYQVMQLDGRMVVLKDVNTGYSAHFPNRHFTGQDFVNITKQHPKMGARLSIEIDLDSGNDPDKVLELLNQAAEYVIKTESGFYPWYRTRLLSMGYGTFTFLLAYECDPSLSFNGTKSTMNLAVTRFLKLGGVDISAGEVTVKPYNSRLKDMYRLSVLRVLSVEEVSLLADVSKVVTCKAGQYLIKRGETADSMYFLVEGELDVFIPNDQGEEIQVGKIWPGDCVGEMSLLAGDPRSADVRAKTNAVLLEITKENISPIFDATPELIDQISIVLERRKGDNLALLNKPLSQEEIESGAKLLAKKILKFFFSKG